MKPPAFDYHAPASLDEALALLAEHGDEAKVLAGGQSLVPAMNFRLARPSVLIDLNNIDTLAGIATDADGLRIGAMTRQRRLEREPTVAEIAPLIQGALPHVAHPQIRNRATFGGSLAHADPAAELPVVLLVLGGSLVLRSAAGERTVDGEAFYTGLFETALTPEEIVHDIRLPRPAARSGWGFEEMSRRHGDYALVGVAAQVTLGPDGRCTDGRVALLSVGDGPVVASAAAAELIGQMPSEEAIRAAAATCAHRDIDPIGDLHASRAYRIHLAEVLTRRVLTAACRRARGESP